MKYLIMRASNTNLLYKHMLTAHNGCGVLLESINSKEEAIHLEQPEVYPQLCEELPYVWVVESDERTREVEGLIVRAHTEAFSAEEIAAAYDTLRLELLTINSNVELATDPDDESIKHFAIPPIFTEAFTANLVILHSTVLRGLEDKLEIVITDYDKVINALSKWVAGLADIDISRKYCTLTLVRGFDPNPNAAADEIYIYGSDDKFKNLMLAGLPTSTIPVSDDTRHLIPGVNYVMSAEDLNRFEADLAGRSIYIITVPAAELVNEVLKEALGTDDSNVLFNPDLKDLINKVKDYVDASVESTMNIFTKISEGR